MIKIGVDSFIWTEIFTEKDLWIIPKAKELGFDIMEFAIAEPFNFPTEKVKAEVDRVGFDQVITSTTLGLESNPISPDAAIRAEAVRTMKKLVDISVELGAKIIGGVNYAGWGYLTKKPRTQQEWDWSVACMKEVAAYALEKDPELRINVECINRFETHFLNIAEDAVQYCKDVGTPNMGVHLDCFHMIREETSFKGAVETAGKYLGYVHVCENNRGIPGTGLVPFRELFEALKGIGYDGPVVIESFDPSFEVLNGNCAIWRTFADSGEDLAIQGLANLQPILDEVQG